MTSSSYQSLDHQAEAASRRGDLLALFETTQRGLETDPKNERLRYLQTLALARLGQPEAALSSYHRNRIAEINDEDAIALEGRILKDIALHSPPPRRALLLREAAKAYEAAYLRSDGFFSAINTATTLFLAGETDKAAWYAGKILSRTDIMEPQNYYAAATRAEAFLLQGRTTAAFDAYVMAVAMPDASAGARASTTRQALLLLKRLAMTPTEQDHFLDMLRPGPILHFTGNMFAAGWANEARIATDVGRALDELRPFAGYGALACGSDIIVAEALIAHGVELHVVLPFLEDDFMAVSVASGGAAWIERFTKVRGKATSVTFASAMPFIGDDQQFAYGSQLAMGLVRLRGEMLQSRTVQLAVWDGVTANQTAGTAADLAKWRDIGGKSRIIAIDPERPPIKKSRQVMAHHTGPARSLKAILFADFSGFSRLTELALPNFLSTVLGSIGTALDTYAASVLCRNSWGDALFAIISDAPTAVAIALEIQQALTPDRLRKAGLPTEGGMRISLHFGLVYEDFDPIQRLPTFYGTEVTLAARIEPRVPVGAIYATQSFAAVLAQSARHRLIMEYVGTVPLAKDYGSLPMYRLASRGVSPADDMLA